MAGLWEDPCFLRFLVLVCFMASFLEAGSCGDIYGKVSSLLDINWKPVILMFVGGFLGGFMVDNSGRFTKETVFKGRFLGAGSR